MSDSLRLYLSSIVSLLNFQIRLQFTQCCVLLLESPTKEKKKYCQILLIKAAQLVIDFFKGRKFSLVGFVVERERKSLPFCVCMCICAKVQSVLTSKELINAFHLYTYTQENN